MQRFRLILNELGAGLAGRGEDIEEVVKRANPVLRDADRVFGILNAQRDQLAQLASDSEEILGPLSRERSSVAGFFTNAGAAAQASTEKGAALEASLQKLPAFLRELRQTMGSFEYFSNSGHAGGRIARQGRPRADQGDPGADPLLRRLDRLAEVARRQRRSRRAEDPRRRPGGREDPRPRPQRRRPDHRTGRVPGQHQEDAAASTASPT